jgi:hypothetical protein
MTVSNPRLFLILCALAARMAGPAAADDYAQWGKSATLYLKTTADGANVTGTVRRFPVLVRLGGSNFAFAEAKGKGQDIRFSAPGGAHLAYQIDRWDSAKAAAEIWVKLDSVKGNADDQTFTMLWGKADAADSSNGSAVFDSANGFVGVWHMGGSGTAARKNAVSGGWDAETRYFDGNENGTGMIGFADSLDGDSPYGDHLSLGDGYSELSGGFTFSIWCWPASAANTSRLFDLGNGPGLDEILLERSGTSQSIVYENYRSNSLGRSIKVDNCFPVKQWQQFAVTVAGDRLAIYRNGSLIVADTNAGNGITGVRRAFNYLGRNDWNLGSYFNGLLDEPQLSKVARSADWIKLAYANQGPTQGLVFFSKPAAPDTCKATFTMSGDTAVSEGSTLVLKGNADCATGFDWSAVAGPAPRILDPEAKDLQVFLPRIAEDTTLVYRFTATYADSQHHEDVTVTLRADIPDPAFTLPAILEWNGKDSLLVKPEITNMAAVKASKQPDVHYSWAVADMAVDTAWRDSGLMLRSPEGNGDISVNLCVDNNGPSTCKSMIVTVQLPVGLGQAATANSAAPRAPGYDAAGRRLPAASAQRIPAGPVFRRPASLQR